MSAKNPTVSVELTARELRVITNLLGWDNPYTTLSDKLSDAEKRMRLATREKNRARKAARKASTTHPDKGAEMNTTAAWTTENSAAIVWGTHDPETAKTIYNTQGLEYAPDWDSGVKMWAAPHLVEEETWDAEEYGTEPREGWTPYLVLDLA